MTDTKDDSRIDLFRYTGAISRIFRKLWPIVLIPALLLGCLSWVRAKRDFRPYYESKALLKVSFGYNPDNILSNPGTYDNTAAQQLAAAFPNLLNTDVMRDLMLVRLGKSYINGSVSARSFPDSNLLLLTVRSNSPSDAYDVLCAVIDCYPQVAAYMTENPNILISEAPAVPTEPVNTFSGRGAVTGGVLKGALIGFLPILLYALFRKTVTSPDELRAVVNLPILATFPKLSVKKRRSSGNSLLPAMKRAGFAESTREFRIRLLKKLTEGQKIIMITGTLPGEGKTTVSINLARTLGEHGKKVVLLDCDLHKQDVAVMLDAKKPTPGLADYLQNDGLRPSDCLAEVKGMPFSYISGSTSRARLWESDKEALERFFGELAARFDYVIVDTPPCGVVSDSTLLCRFADSILYVVKEDYAGRSQILDGVNSLSDRGAALTGCIINGIVGTGRRYGYGYGYKYGYGKYGYRSKYGNGRQKDDPDGNGEAAE